MNFDGKALIVNQYYDKFFDVYVTDERVYHCKKVK